MAYFVYNEGAESLLDGSVVWASDTIKARLIASVATPNKDDDDLASGYTAIGTDQTLGSKTRTKDDTNDRVVYDAADATWSAVAGGSTVGWCIIYKDDGGNGVPIAALDITDTPTNGGDITVQFNASGIFYLQQ
jgi:hypothetical protein